MILYSLEAFMKLKVVVFPVIVLIFVVALSFVSRVDAADSWDYRYTFTNTGLNGPTVGNLFRDHSPEAAAIATPAAAAAPAASGEVDLAASLDCSTQ
jgi:hypothetical protein